MAASRTVSGSVAVLLESTRGKMNCPQPNRNVTMAVAAMPGLAVGRTTRTKACSVLAPSMRAASSMLLGKSVEERLKNLVELKGATCYRPRNLNVRGPQTSLNVVMAPCLRPNDQRGNQAPQEGDLLHYG